MSETSAGRADGSWFLSASIFDLSLNEVDRILTAILARIGIRMTRFEGQLDLDDIFIKAPRAGGAHPYKLALYEPLVHPGSTVMVVNLVDGWSSVVGLIAREHTARQIQATGTIDSADFPSFHFHMWEGGKEQRLIMALRDSSKWIFVQRGIPLPFERPEDLARRRTRDRINRPIILSYLRNLGWDLEEDDFWRSRRPAIYFEQGLTKH